MSKSQHRFSEIPKADIQRSSFDRSHGWKGTLDAGLLVPFFVDEALPGDTFNLKCSVFARLATPIKPIFDNMYADTFFFAVPNRLLWDNWEKFNGQQDNPGDSTDYSIPQWTPPAGGWQTGTIPDAMGLPTGVENISVSSLPLRAYYTIWNEWFRDENLQLRANVGTGDTPSSSGGTIFRRGKRHDYFTSCLPFAQKGEPVSLPLGVSAPVVPTGSLVSPTWQNSSSESFGYLTQVDGGNLNAGWETSPAAAGEQAYWLNPGLQADLSDATAATINDIRQAFQIQRLLERDARGGSRYTEIIRAHFNVNSPDQRLQRPEFLGGGTSMVNFNPVQQNQATQDGVTPQGNLAAMATVSFTGHGFTKSFTEHCTLIGLVSIRADLNYQQGINRMWNRQTRYDFYWPALSHIGEQAVLNKEIYAQGNSEDEDVFGYQERYAEYRYKPSLITGKFRSQDAETLDYWHLAQEFTALPTLSSTFIEENPPVDRIIAVPDEPHLLMDAYFNLKCSRPMPLYGVPGFVDHF